MSWSVLELTVSWRGWESCMRLLSLQRVWAKCVLESPLRNMLMVWSSSQYADPVLDRLDPERTVAHRLFRESCYNHRGNYVKVSTTHPLLCQFRGLIFFVFQDLSQLGRDIGDTIIIDNSPASYIFHPHNAIPVSSWFSDIHDTELGDMSPFLADLSTVGDVRGILDPTA